MSKTITKKISELFEPENGNSKYTKALCKEHSGEFIVYTGTTIEIFAKVDFADYTTSNLTSTTDGEKAGTIEYITICEEKSGNLICSDIYGKKGIGNEILNCCACSWWLKRDSIKEHTSIVQKAAAYVYIGTD